MGGGGGWGSWGHLRLNRIFKNTGCLKEAKFICHDNSNTGPRYGYRIADWGRSTGRTVKIEPEIAASVM